MIQKFRSLSGDKENPPHWDDDDIAGKLNEAEQRACICGRLIYEDASDEVCVIDLDPTEHTYPLHPKVFEIVILRITATGGESREVPIKSREWLNANYPDWRNSTSEAWAAIQSDTSLRIVGAISSGDVANIECYRLPLEDMAGDDDAPEIHDAHHIHLVDWALHLAFLDQDTDWFDANRSAIHEGKFTKYFGLLPDSDMRRSTRADSIQHNEPYIF